VSTSISEITRIVKSHPNELKYLFKSPNEDKRRLTRIISHLVPYRVGIEFETFGSVGNYLFPKDSISKSGGFKLYTRYEKRINDLIRKKLKLTDFREDTHNHSMTTYINHCPSGEEEIELNEVRISINGYKQLIILWDTLQILNKCLIIPKINGGIHIHIDAPFVSSNDGKEFALNWFNQQSILSKILQIFEGYSGTFNRRGAGLSKSTYVRITDYPTIEFRIGRLTYDYSTLMRYIIKCSELVRNCKTDFINYPKKFSKDKVQVPSKIECNGSSSLNTSSTEDGVNDTEEVTNTFIRYTIEDINNFITNRIGTSSTCTYWSPDGNSFS